MPLTSLPSLRVLYIDDDPALGRLVQRHFGRSGHEVVLAEDGEAGLVAVRAAGFDAIALDHYMPGRDGLDVLDELLRLPDIPPIIFVTAAEEPRIAVAALKQGAADYVVKDVGGKFLDALAKAIRAALHERELRRQRDRAEQDLREQRDRLEALTRQQALMLREMNHRVANSLQLITSLIELQGRRVRDPEARAMLQRAAERVDAVSRVHRRLYTSGEVGNVQMDQYLAGLVDELNRAATSEGAAGPISLQAEPVRIETDRAISIGLIVNELVTNALKYAYPHQATGPVRVRLGRVRVGHEGEVTQLVVEDDGVGIGTGAPQGSGLGRTIVQAMAAQLRAAVEQDTAHRGARFTVAIPDTAPA